MTEKTLHLRLGLAASVMAVTLIALVIPNWVAAPSNVPNIVLSPLFWPYTLAILIGLTGLGLLLTSMRMGVSDEALVDQLNSSAPSGGAWLRMVGIAIIMLVSLMLFSRLGMVWACILSFLATAFLIRTRHPIAAVVCAVIIPLILYAFFAHVAGVAIPQGAFVRLP